ncbi:MAG: site-specific DNA-methyltransferase [Candidatus Pacebacteria bacterium]|nr:site-specific DNA-methyltransferase [Candidatus Paceibacterota bacterium]
MPILNWIGKEKIVNHDKDVAFRLLKKNQKYSLGNSENLILEGDNLEALKALMPFYYGKIKCIYIDPPYNTGNEKWVYNDKVNSPKISEWFKKVVGPEGDDLCRHDKWLCMMYPRLKLLYDLLSDDGVIFVSIDDNEQPYLRILMDEIFKVDNFESFVWKKKGGAGNTERIIGNLTEYILCYFKNKRAGIFNYRNIEREYKYKDHIGPYNLEGLEKTNQGGYERKTMMFPIIDPKTRKKFYPKAGMRWTAGKETVGHMIKEGRIHFDYGKKRIYIIKRPVHYAESENVFYNLLLDVGSLSTAKDELERIGFKRELFDTPKPVALIKRILQIATNQNDLILDSFAGSGTTGHAVLELNKEDGGNRKFILVEMEKNIAKNITAERVKRVAKGYLYKKSNGEMVKVAGLGGGFEFVELGEPLFDKDGTINKTVSFEDMARYVYFTETRTNLEKKNIKANYLGEFGSTHYFLLFNGIGKNILDRKFLTTLKGINGKKIVYADKCLLDEEILEKHQIIFKQIPYQVKIY